nr:DUF3267 domain-containing protein [Ramlibacter algicola]
MKGVHWLLVLAVFVASVIAHEAIHAIAWYLASAKPRPRFKFGVNWGALMPYAHAIDPMHAKAYRIGAAAPGVVLGALPAASGLATGSAGLTVWGTAMLLVAGGDFLVIATLRGVPPMTPVKDHPVRVGCEIVETAAGGS